MKIKSKPAQSTQTQDSRLVVDLYGCILSATGLGLSIAQDVLQHLENKVEQRYMRLYEQSVHKEKPSS